MKNRKKGDKNMGRDGFKGWAMYIVHCPEPL